MTCRLWGGGTVCEWRDAFGTDHHSLRTNPLAFPRIETLLGEIVIRIDARGCGQARHGD